MNSNCIVLYKPENLFKRDSLKNSEPKIKATFEAYKKLAEEDSDNYLSIYTEEKSLLEKEFPGIKEFIIESETYQNNYLKASLPVTIYYQKEDKDSENELKKDYEKYKNKLSIKAIEIDDKNNIKVIAPEWINTENKTIEFNEEYFGVPADKLYIYARKKDIDELNCMIDIGKPIFIYGERGTGKTTIIQSYVKSKLGIDDKKFVSVACGTLEPAMAKSEMFGHVKGAYTDAKEETKGYVGMADGGCLYLDEVQDLSREVQRMLIKCIDEHKYYKLGSDKTCTSDFLLICSSNRPLREVKDYLYEDFYDRINFFQMKIDSIDEQKKADKTGTFLSDCLSVVWNNYKEKSKNKDIFLDYNRLEDFNFSSGETVQQKLVDALQRKNLKGNYRDIQKLLSYIELFVFNKQKAFQLNNNKAINEKIDAAIEKWETFIDERDSEIPDLTDAFIKKHKWEGINRMFKAWIADQFITRYGNVSAASRELGVDKNSINNAIKFLDNSPLL